MIAVVPQGSVRCLVPLFKYQIVFEDESLRKDPINVRDSFLSGAIYFGQFRTRSIKSTECRCLLPIRNIDVSCLHQDWRGASITSRIQITKYDLGLKSDPTEVVGETAQDGSLLTLYCELRGGILQTSMIQMRVEATKAAAVWLLEFGTSH